MAVMHWCWSLNKISSPAPWIRAVKRFSCNILSSPRGKKWSGSIGFVTLICLLQFYTALHTVPRISRSVVTNEATGEKSEERWHVGLYSLQSSSEFGARLLPWPLLSHLPPGADRTKQCGSTWYATAGQNLLIIALVRKGLLSILYAAPLCAFAEPWRKWCSCERSDNTLSRRRH